MGLFLLAASMNGSVDIQQEEDVVRAMVSGHPVLVYQAEQLLPPEGVDPVYAGSGFIHPLYTPAGSILTVAFPVDHAHQHGVFSAWTKATFNHESVDFWNKHLGTGYFEHVSIDAAGSSGFVVTRRMVSRIQGPAINETWEVKIQDRADVFIIDLKLKQEPATTQEVILHRYHYGGFAFRGSENWNAKAGNTFQSEMQILTGSGTVDRRLANNERPRWVCAYGALGEKTGGVVIMDHPMNFRYPQPVRVHPSMPYFTFSPAIEGPFILYPGFMYQARYRLITFDGEPDPVQIEDLYQSYMRGEAGPDQ